MAIQKIVTDDALSAFASDVKAAIANVSSPLVYKGTLGTGGTISTLPAASASNNGFAYVVITAGTYQGVVCAVGDVIASNGTAWNIIPQANSAETLPITTGSAVNTKEYIDDKTTLVKSASDSLIHITDGGDNIPLKACSITIEPDLSGYTEANLFVCGKNLIENKKYQQSTQAVVIGWNAYTNIGKTYLKAGTYTFSADMSNTGALSVKENDNSPYVIKNFYTTGHVSTTFTITEDSTCRFYIYNAQGIDASAITNFQIELGERDTGYEEYNGTKYNIPFGQTVTAGGTLDVISGELVVGGVTTQLTPVSPKTISGVNYIYNDCGDTAIEYFTSSADEVAALIEVLSNS